MGIRADILTAIDESGVSDRALSLVATGGSDTVRNMRRGSTPNLETLEALCRHLGLDLCLRSRRGERNQASDQAQHHGDGAASPASLPSPTRFQEKELPVRVWAYRSPKGYLTNPHEFRRAPAPEDLPNPKAFYAVTHSPSMWPAGIAPDDVCLISPGVGLTPGERVWLRNRRGQEAIMWLVEIAAAACELRAWGREDDHYRQELLRDRWQLADLVESGVVVRVFRSLPSLERPQLPVPDWRPLPSARRLALFGPENVGEGVVPALKQLEEKLSVLKQVAAAIKTLAAQGGPDSQLLWLLDLVERTRQSVDLVTAVIGTGADRWGRPGAENAPATPREIARLLDAIVQHYEVLNEYGRAHFIADVQHHFPALRGEQIPRLDATREEQPAEPETAED